VTGKLYFTSRVKRRDDKTFLVFTARDAAERTYLGYVDLHGRSSFEAVYDHYDTRPVHYRFFDHRIHADTIKGNLQRYADIHPPS